LSAFVHYRYEIFLWYTMLVSHHIEHTDFQDRFIDELAIVSQSLGGKKLWLNKYGTASVRCQDDRQSLGSDQLNASGRFNEDISDLAPLAAGIRDRHFDVGLL
jgi:hypothetical protein